MIYHINIKNVKRSIHNLNNFLLQQGYKVPISVLLEGLARCLFFKNWKSLEISITNPSVIKYYKNFCKYLIEVETNCDKTSLLKFFDEAAYESSENITIANFIQNKNSYHIEINFISDECNVFPCLAKIYNKIQASYFEINSFECCQLMHKKHDCINMFSHQKAYLN